MGSFIHCRHPELVSKSLEYIQPHEILKQVQDDECSGLPRFARNERNGLRALINTIVALIFLSFSAPAAAQTGLPPAPYANKQLDDPAQEAEARALMEELRCLKCQSQSIADSNAPMAGDMRSQVRERIEQGWSAERIRNWLVERYGNWVTYDPPMTAVTWPLWIMPIILLIAALWLARGLFRRKKDKS